MPRQFLGDTLVLATHNQKKIAEISGFLAGRVPHLLTSKELHLPEPIETGTTFFENATIKAVQTARACKMPALSDDSGLCIAALNGAPGVYTADLAGYPRNWKMMCQRILSDMGDRPDRAAYFQAVIVLAWPDGHIEVAEGRIDGMVTRMMRGTYGFGADPVFMPLGHSKTLAEMIPAQKLSMSHRARAVTQMINMCF